ncbi:MAG: polyketide synthase dehydratase domain-containing protein, partial [Deltaproteobacteria bacterium]|nr:polyketide synthase dehydratase domain-containing protein [Deltaproteobacteria bacterium]
GLRLAPAWPLDSRPDLIVDDRQCEPVATVDGMRFGQASLLACAWGRPSEAFGPAYRVFDGPRRLARLPGPPYHFMSRVSRVDGPPGKLQAGIAVEVAYDVPPDAWYFEASGGARMPFCVLLEVALQPCGWLACYVGSALASDEDMSFRNLDGTGTLLGEVGPDAGALRTRATLTSIASNSGVWIESFDVVCLLGDRPIYTMQTVFGFFPPPALAQQLGLPTSSRQRAALTAASSFFVDLTSSPDRYCAGPLRLPAPFLRMIDRVTGWWPTNDLAPLPRLRAELDVKPEHWSFKAHFFQDPVQPGSLGIEAMIQLLQFAVIQRGLADGMTRPRFEPLARDRQLVWKYRGQVVPENERVTIVLDLVEESRDERGPIAVAEASLWVDGRRIYEAKNLCLRVVEEEPAAEEVTDDLLDPQRDRWLADHRPTWTVPVLPMMCIADRLAAAVRGPVVGLRDVAVKTWLTLPRPRVLRTRVDGAAVTLLVSRLDGASGELEEIARGEVLTGAYPPPPEPLPPLAGAPAPDPYASGALFHGPAFQLLRSLAIGAAGASAVLDAGAGAVPFGILHPALLDAATHAIPHDRLRQWSDEIGDDVVAYPALIESLDLFRPPPDRGPVRCEVRCDGFYTDPLFPRFRIQLSDRRGVWAEMRLVEACFPKGALGRAEPALRRAFLRDHCFVPGLALSAVGDQETRLVVDDVQRSDWLPGTVAAVYGSADPEAIALKDHLAAQVGVHPRWIPEALPFNRVVATVQRQGGQAVARGPAVGALDLTAVRAYWSRRIGIGPWPVEDLYYGLVERFVRSVVVVDPPALAALRGRSLFFLANHQVAVESLLFAVVASGLTGLPTVTLAKAEHRQSWLGTLIRHSFAYPGVRDPGVITFFDRDDRDALPGIVAELGADMAGAGKSAMVHVEGTRALDCRSPVVKMSGLFIDMALQVGAPIVPVRFWGGLPAEPLPQRIEFPLAMGRQDYFIGRPLLPEELTGLAYKERKQRVIDAINALGPARAEQPGPGDPAFAGSVREWSEQSGAGAEHAVLLRTLQALPAPSEQIARLLDGLRAGRLEPGADDRGRWLAVLARWLFGPRGPQVG